MRGRDGILGEIVLFTALIYGTNMNFTPFGPQPVTSGGKKKPGSLLGTMPSSRLPESKAGNTLFLCFALLFLSISLA